MPNRSQEQGLIDSFIKALGDHKDNDLRIKTVLNANCRSKKNADIEFISMSDSFWVIEATSHCTTDAYNTAHKIFGKLLKETGRSNRDNCKFAVLIPEEAKNFYSKLFQYIKRDKFIGFGELIPLASVFTYGKSGIGMMSWEELFEFSLNK